MYRFKELRIEKKQSQTVVAKAIGISQSVLCDYENDKAEPTSPVIIALAKYYDVTTDYLLGLSDY